MTDEAMKQVYTLVDTMTTDSTPKEPGKDPTTINMNNPELARQGILRGRYFASVIRTMQVNAVMTDDGEELKELDIHADTCVINHHVLIVHEFNCTVNVVEYDP